MLACRSRACCTSRRVGVGVRSRRTSLATSSSQSVILMSARRLPEEGGRGGLDEAWMMAGWVGVTRSDETFTSEVPASGSARSISLKAVTGLEARHP